MHDTWAARDLPVLDATVSLLEQSFMVTVTDIALRTGLEPIMVARALEALDPVYVDFRKTTTGGDPRFWYVFKVTPEARRVVGQWPTAEALASRMADELAGAARQETDPERQGLLIYAARLIGDTLRDATVRAAAQVLTPPFGEVPQPELGAPLPVRHDPVPDAAATGPAATGPDVTGPTATEPTATEPTATEPTATDPTAAEVTATEATATEVTATEPETSAPSTIVSA